MKNQIIMAFFLTLSGVLFAFDDGTKPLRRKTCVITGGTSGIGYETSLLLLEKGCSVIVGARDMNKANKIVEEVKKKHPDYDLRFVYLDLSSFESVKDFVTWLLENIIAIDIFINNAGVYQKELITTEDGLESTFQTNFIAPFFLTEEIRKKQLMSIDGTILNIVSERLGVFDLTKQGWCSKDGGIDWSHRFSLPGNVAYSQSKLMLLMYSHWLQRQFTDSGDSIKVMAFHPGAIATKIYDNVPFGVGKVATLFMKKPEKSAEEIFNILTGKIKPKNILIENGCKKEVCDLVNNVIYQDYLVDSTQRFLEDNFSRFRVYRFLTILRAIL